MYEAMDTLIHMNNYANIDSISQAIGFPLYHG